jgi:hypothetical protein
MDATKTARRNNAHRATFTHDALDHPFANGAFRWVAKGVYTHGDRTGEECVCKWFKTGGVMEARFYEKDLEACNEALTIITKWNTEGVINRMVKVNMPEVWTFLEGSTRAGQKVLQEPYIIEYQKFNSNTGWSDNTLPWHRVMQALSHFSYHISNGQTVLCDLQGGVYQDGVILTDPVVLSMDQRFGVTDLGNKGISSFFYHHMCNEYCRSSWRKPPHVARYYEKKEGTTMEVVPTRTSRPPLTLDKLSLIEE